MTSECTPQWYTIVLYLTRGRPHTLLKFNTFKLDSSSSFHPLLHSNHEILQCQKPVSHSSLSSFPTLPPFKSSRKAVDCCVNIDQTTTSTTTQFRSSSLNYWNYLFLVHLLPSNLDTLDPSSTLQSKSLRSRKSWFSSKKKTLHGTTPKSKRPYARAPKA